MECAVCLPVCLHLHPRACLHSINCTPNKRIQRILRSDHEVSGTTTFNSLCQKLKIRTRAVFNRDGGNWLLTALAYYPSKLICKVRLGRDCPIRRTHWQRLEGSSDQMPQDLQDVSLNEGTFNVTFRDQKPDSKGQGPCSCCGEKVNSGDCTRFDSVRESVLIQRILRASGLRKEKCTISRAVNKEKDWGNSPS